jgi:predicted GIY-YIG superfamily endonuclease
MTQETKRFVYVIVNNVNNAPYVGVTSDITRRLDTHNSGGSVHTKAWRPWRLAVSLEFATESRALQFESYLKSGSGRAFMTRHFL